MKRGEELLAELARIDAADCGPLPHEDCRKLQQVRGADASLLPDLDAYLSEIAGYRSWGKRVGGWTDEKIDEVERRLDASFFDRFAAHETLRDAMDSDEFADLGGALARADRTRALLRDLLREVKADRNPAAK